MRVLVVAKAPVAGQVKTRLCPPLTAQQAAEVAEAALADTLAAVAACGADQRVLALDGRPGPWLPPGFDVVAQRGDRFDQRLAAAWDDAGSGTTLQIGMDTPQVSAADLDDALAALERPHVGAVLGHAPDGGWWAIGLRRADRRVFLGVPMSTPATGRAQLARLHALGLRVTLLPEHRDLDRIDDAHALAAAAPHTATAAVLRRVLAPERVPA